MPSLLRTPPSAQPTGSTALSLRDVTKAYDSSVTALDDVSLDVPRGAFLAVMGPSGSGKSTLLHCASGLDTPSSGAVLLGDVELSRLSETRRTTLRRGRIGFIFQAYNLVPSLTVEQNITLPLRLAHARPDRAWIEELVGRIGLAHLLQRRPGELSGGQQQRVAIARSLAARPDIVFADEPTGALDLDTAGEVLALLRDLVDEFGQTVVMVTHDPVAAGYTDRVVFLGDGKVVDEMRDPTAERVLERMAQFASQGGPGA